MTRRKENAAVVWRANGGNGVQKNPLHWSAEGKEDIAGVYVENMLNLVIFEVVMAVIMKNILGCDAV
jgi:hypothetical protein